MKEINLLPYYRDLSIYSQSNSFIWFNLIDYLMAFQAPISRIG